MTDTTFARVEATFDGAKLNVLTNGIPQKCSNEIAFQEVHDRLLVITIPWSADFGWQHLFGQMETLYSELDIEDYSITQSSLEQIFLAFTDSLG